MDQTTKSLLMQLPAIDKLIKAPLLADYSVSIIKDSGQEVISKLRKSIVEGTRKKLPESAEIVKMVKSEAEKRGKSTLTRVINASGTIIHTNLGRSLLSDQTRELLENIAYGYSNLEFDLGEGVRGSRYRHLEPLIQELTGAESVLVVNNNAAAVMLALSTLAKDQEILISRGELVEIGGSFRIPDIIELSGCRICEVGTTNKTHLQDYQKRLEANEQIGAVMKVHTSNYRIIGFTETPPVQELAALAHRYEVPIINDLGSGLLVDLRPFGLPYEPTVKENIAQGCDIVMFSGDKLLGGPQAGIIVGKRQYLEPMKKNPLLRALRVDKLTIASLISTLTLYRENRIFEIPTLQMISRNAQSCLTAAEQLAILISDCQLQLNLRVEKESSNVGGGAYPETLLPTYVLGITSPEYTALEIERHLRSSPIPIISRIKKNQVLFDLRTLTEHDFLPIVESLKNLFYQK